MKQDTRNMLTHDIYIAVEEITGKIYKYQMSRFPVKYSQGNSYVMVIYDYEIKFYLNAGHEKPNKRSNGRKK